MSKTQELRIMLKKSCTDPADEYPTVSGYFVGLLESLEKQFPEVATSLENHIQYLKENPQHFKQS